MAVAPIILIPATEGRGRGIAALESSLGYIGIEQM